MTRSRYGTLTFQIKTVKGQVATGQIRDRMKYPRRDDFFVQTGEVEFQHRQEPTGFFNDAAHDVARDVWYAQKSDLNVNIPDNVKVKPGQFIRIKFNDNDEATFVKDRVGQNVSVKKFLKFDFSTDSYK